MDSFAVPFGGRVINLAINLRQKVELYTEDDMWGVTTTIPFNANTDLLYPVRKEYGLDGMHQTRVVTSFDGIIGAGLGSSGSFAVCLVGAIHRNLHFSMDRDIIAQKAYEIEVEKLLWYGGKQDQWASAYGGVNLLEIGKADKINPLSKKNA